MKKSKPQYTHGTMSCYCANKCRCDKCMARMREYYRDYRKRKPRVHPVPHGTVTGYTSRGCRCMRCKAANRKRWVHRYWKIVKPQLRAGLPIELARVEGSLARLQGAA